MNLTDALSYPIRRNGWIMILVGTVFSLLLDYLKFLPVIGLIVTVFSLGYFGAYYLDIIRTTLTGRDEVPDWPSFGSFSEDILTPLGLLLGLVLLSFGPAIAIKYFLDQQASWHLPAQIGGVAYGCFYFPMAVLATQVFGGLGAALPHVVFPAIARAVPGYLVAVLVLVVVVTVCALAQTFTAQVPFVGGLLTTPIALYSLMFQGRLIGLLYRDKRETIGWE